MSIEFWIALLSSSNVGTLIAIVFGETIAILVMARYIVKLVEKLIGMSTKSSEVLEKLSNDFRIRQDKD